MSQRHCWQLGVWQLEVWRLIRQYIAHSARNSLADFERPLLAPQPTDLHDKKRGLILEIRSTRCHHQNVNPGTFFLIVKTSWKHSLDTHRFLIKKVAGRRPPITRRNIGLKVSKETHMFYVVVVFLNCCYLFHLLSILYM